MIRFVAILLYSILNLSLRHSPLTHNETQYSEIWQVKNNSVLEINGTTNIKAPFTCSVDAYEWSQYLKFIDNKNDKKSSNFEICNFDIPVKEFDCGLWFITSEFNNTLKSKQFPLLNIKLTEVSDKISGLKTGSTVNTKAIITLTNISRQYDVKFKIKKIKDLHAILVSNQIIRFSDFELTPPTRFSGKVKTSDELKINITLNLKQLK